jgi:hypothetical protein
MPAFASRAIMRACHRACVLQDDGYSLNSELSDVLLHVQRSHEAHLGLGEDASISQRQGQESCEAQHNVDKDWPQSWVMPRSGDCKVDEAYKHTGHKSTVGHAECVQGCIGVALHCFLSWRWVLFTMCTMAEAMCKVHCAPPVLTTARTKAASSCMHWMLSSQGAGARWDAAGMLLHSFSARQVVAGMLLHNLSCTIILIWHAGRGIAHLDVKMRNFMFHRHCQDLFIIDFGETFILVRCVTCAQFHLLLA